MKRHRSKNKNHFRTAREELTQLKKHEEVQHQAEPPSHKLAFSDIDFMLRQELRPVRLQLELLKPEVVQQDQNIRSTVVIFGSARIHEPAIAQAKLEEVKVKLAAHPDEPKWQKQLKIAEKMVWLSRYYEEARKLARIISADCQKGGARDFVIVTGGGPGIMEAANRGAYDINAKSIGLNITLPREQTYNPYITPELNFQFHYFAIRKMHFLIRARALIAFPGGYGTLDELFEALTLMQTRKIEVMPIILFGREFWNKILNFEALVDMGTIDPEDLNLFKFAETAEEAWKIIADFYDLKQEDLGDDSTSL